jgi:hypothetical protein
MTPVATDSDLATIDSCTGLDTETKRILREVRISIDTIVLSAEDKADVFDVCRKFAVEISKPEPSPDRLLRYWNWMNELAPTAAHELAKSATVQRLSMRWGECIQAKGGFINETAAEAYVRSIQDRRIRDAVASAHGVMLELSMFEGVRPEGAFDLLYFYKCLASWLQPLRFQWATEDTGSE